MKRSYVIAVVFACTLALWMLSGQFTAGNGSDEAPQETAQVQNEQLFAVRARTMTAQTRDASLVLRGETEAVRTVSVRAETSGRVVELPMREGALVDEGDVLCRLDVRDRQARLSEARAAVEQRQLEYKAAQQLSGRGFTSETQAAGAMAALDAAQAALTAARIDLANTQIKAPFSGILDNIGVEVGDLIQIGEVCGIIVDQDPFLVVTQVSEREVGLLDVGTRATAELVTGGAVEGTVRFISTRAQDSTRTFRVEVEVPNPDGTTFRDGVSAELRIPVRSVAAHRLSPALLTLNTDGQLGVRTLVNGSEVLFQEIQVIEDEGDGVWVTGLDETVTIITVGQEFVVDGQTVDVDLENGGDADLQINPQLTGRTQNRRG